MNNSKSHSALICIAVLLTACGSKPLPQPAAVTTTRDAMSLGMQAYNDNRYLEARGYFERALVQYRSVDDRSGQLDALTNLADSALEQGETVAAQNYLTAADTILASGAFSAHAPHLALLHAYADMQAGDAQPVAEQLDKLLGNDATPPDIRQSALLARAQCAFDLDAADAPQWLDKLGKSLNQHTDPLGNARYQRLQALAARKQGDTQKSATLYRSALESYRSRYYRPGIAATLEEWADLSISQQDWGTARDRLQRALDIRLWLYDRNHSAKDLEKLSQMDAKLGNTEASKRDLQLAEYLKNGGDPAHLPGKS